MAKPSSKVAWLTGILACAAVVFPALSASPQGKEKPAAAPRKVSPYAAAMSRQRAQATQDARAPAKPASMPVGQPPSLTGHRRRH
jgi:hypothetical protein